MAEFTSHLFPPFSSYYLTLPYLGLTVSASKPPTNYIHKHYVGTTSATSPPPTAEKTRHQTKSTLYILQTCTIRTASSSVLRRYPSSRTAAKRYLAVAEIEEASRTTLNRLLLPILLEYLQDLLNTIYIFRRYCDDLRA